MKKIIGVSLSLLLLFSCSENVDLYPINQDLSIKNALENYNKSIINESNLSKGKFLRWLGIVAADAVGAYVGTSIGGPIVGAAIAGKASDAAGSINNDDINYNPDFEVVYIIPSDYIIYDIGKQHNDILANVFHGEYEMRNYLLDNYGEEATIAYYSEDIQNINNMVVEEIINYSENYNYRNLLNSLKSKGLVSEKAETIIFYFIQAFFTSSSDSQISEILDFYSQTVLKSRDLLEKEKTALFSMFSVTRSSSNYWTHIEH